MSAQKLKYLSILLKNLPDTLPECGNESEIGVEVHSGMESDDVGPEVPPEDNRRGSGYQLSSITQNHWTRSHTHNCNGIENHKFKSIIIHRHLI